MFERSAKAQERASSPPADSALQLRQKAAAAVVVAELFLLLLAATMAELMRADPLPDHLKWIMMR